MRRIAIFLDGTWNTPESHTNVFTLYEQTHGIDARKLDPLHENLEDQKQIKYYDKGVGTSFYSIFLGGILGLGLSENIREAYRFLCTHYQADDEIYIFGFSRGAYTARSLVGLISTVGLLPKEKATTKNIKALYDIYKEKNQHQRLSNVLKTITEYSCYSVRVKFIGVWDTVGALGIPKSFWGDKFPWLWKLLDFEMNEMHNTKMSSIVDYAFHAVAIDEHRPDFDVTLWEAMHENNEEVEQCWFCGAHANIGGGEKDNKLNKIAFHWMQEKATLKGKGLVFYHDSKAANTEELTLEPVSDSYQQFLFNIYGFITPILKKIGIGRKAHDLKTKQNNDDNNESDTTIEKKKGKTIKEFRTARNFRKINLNDTETKQRLHSSVLLYCQNHDDYRPPNLPIDQLISD